MQMHQQFFSATDDGVQADARRLLATRRELLLAGTTLAFSRVVPVGEDVASHPMSRMARALGATVATELTPTVSHLVTTAPGTQKVRQARQMGVQVVSLQWLVAAWFLWLRPDEALFPPDDAPRSKSDGRPELEAPAALVTAPHPVTGARVDDDACR
jgi:RNA polymerase II C-terminal domain phosphatase-like 3/4